MYICVLCACLVTVEVRRWCRYLSESESQTVVSYHVGAGNQASAFGRAASAFKGQATQSLGRIFILLFMMWQDS